MKNSGWKRAVALSCVLLAMAASAAGAGDVMYHGGPVIVSAKVVFLFWGPSFSNAASPDFAYAQALQSFRNQLGTSSSWQVVTQYSGIQLTNLGAGTPDWFDTTTPPTNVTDTKVQGEVKAYLASHGFDNSTIYEVVIPSTSYSSSGGITSCGGPSLGYCAYHSSFLKGTSAVKYSIQPYPSCGGCQVSGWSATQDQEHFVCFETRDTVTDPTGGGWYDSQGKEICEKCPLPLPAPPPSFSTVCGPAWSNQSHGCVLTR
ncbi:MAG: hypothetical protein WAM82_18320 [Thermoanaerobaculia bacterium]